MCGNVQRVSIQVAVHRVVLALSLQQFRAQHLALRYLEQLK